MVSLFVITFIVLIFILACQFTWMTEKKRKSPPRTLFGETKTSSGSWRWWKWPVVFLLFLGTAGTLLSVYPDCSKAGIFLLTILAVAYWLFMKFVNRQTSPGKRFFLEFILILILVNLAFFGLKSIQYLSGPSGSAKPFIGENWWNEIRIYVILNSLFLLAISQFLRYSFEIWDKNKAQKALNLTRLKRELNLAQLETLQTRINPHFLYNSLNSIAGLALTDGENTRKMALSLSRFFSYCTDKNATYLIPVGEEAEIIKTYLDIEKIRFGERLDYNITLEKESEKFLIPRLLLQPLVENSVKHGMQGQQDKLCIHIYAQKTAGGIQIGVEDNGSPFPDDLIPGFGLKNTYDKLDILFPGNYEIELRNAPKKEIRIRLIKKNTHEI